MIVLINLNKIFLLVGEFDNDRLWIFMYMFWYNVECYDWFIWFGFIWFFVVNYLVY